MPNDNKQNALIRRLPDKPLFRKAVSKLKIKLTNRHSLTDAQVREGEQNTEAKNRIVSECRKKWGKAAASAESQISQAFSDLPLYAEMKNDPEKAEELEEIRLDMLFCYFAYGFTPVEYFSFRLRSKSMDERNSFISSRLRQTFRCRMNDLLKAEIFNDKVKTYRRFKEFYKRDATSVSGPEHFERFQRFVKKHPVFVKKQCFEAQGHSVELIDIQNCGKTPKELFDSLIAQGKHILEQKIIQSPALAAFNESSVNTVRAITFVTKNGTVVPYCTLRTGRPGSFVDNGGAGGVQACIDFETGVIVTDGYDEIGGVYADHPASGTTFKGYQMPDWEQLRALVYKLAEVVPEIHFIGWDLAHTENGWVMVEGNENCYIIAKQMIDDRGLRSTFEGIMKDMELVV
ncbi:MAG: hypothetical protein IKI58_06530 [Oscillospiraceae bacterium]|nr:hypothetical protein [Oscillospiraceae bacterium]